MYRYIKAVTSDTNFTNPTRLVFDIKSDNADKISKEELEDLYRQVAETLARNCSILLEVINDGSDGTIQVQIPGEEDWKEAIENCVNSVASSAYVEFE